LTQEQFWGAAAFLNKTRRYEVEDEDVAGITDMKNVKKMKQDADPSDDETEKPKIKAKPAWPEAKEAARKGDREEMARFLTSDPLFAKNIVNRLWMKLMGKGFIERPDGFGSRAKPVHAELLDQLAADFVRSGYDLRSILRQIVNSKAYQYAGQAGDGGPFNVPTLRPLSSDQLLACIVQGTKYGLDEDNSGNDNADSKSDKPSEDAPADAPKMKKDAASDSGPGNPGKEMAMKKQDAADNADEESDGEDADNRPIELFGPAPRTVRSNLTLLNHSEIHDAVESGARYIMKTLGKPVKEKHFEYAYLALLARLPSLEEQKLFAGKRKRSDLEDVLWAVMNSVEFKNNH